MAEIKPAVLLAPVASEIPKDRGKATKKLQNLRKTLYSNLFFCSSSLNLAFSINYKVKLSKL